MLCSFRLNFFGFKAHIGAGPRSGEQTAGQMCTRACTDVLCRKHKHLLSRAKDVALKPCLTPLWDLIMIRK